MLEESHNFADAVTRMAAAHHGRVVPLIGDPLLPQCLARLTVVARES